MNDKTITIYNYHKPSKTWHRTVIEGVSYRYNSEKTVSSAGAIVFAQLLNIIIPDDAQTSGKDYIDAAGYSELDTGQAGKYWTINPAGNQDVIVCGGINTEITDAYTITDLQRDYQKSGTVAAFSDNTDFDLLRHYKVVCK